jgi:hypothetical protein
VTQGQAIDKGGVGPAHPPLAGTQQGEDDLIEPGAPGQHVDQSMTHCPRKLGAPHVPGHQHDARPAMFSAHTAHEKLCHILFSQVMGVEG